MSAAPMPLGPPRLLPMEALYLLGSLSGEAGFIKFIRDLADDGFTLWEPGDEELSLDDWEELSLSRMRILVTAWDIYKERTS